MLLLEVQNEIRSALAHSFDLANMIRVEINQLEHVAAIVPCVNDAIIAICGVIADDVIATLAIDQIITLARLQSIR